MSADPTYFPKYQQALVELSQQIAALKVLEAREHVTMVSSDGPLDILSLAGHAVIKRGYETKWTAGYCAGSKIFKKPELSSAKAFHGEALIFGTGPGKPFGIPGDSGSIILDRSLRPCGLLTGCIETKDNPPIILASAIPFDDALEIMDVEFIVDDPTELLAKTDISRGTGANRPLAAEKVSTADDDGDDDASHARRGESEKEEEQLRPRKKVHYTRQVQAGHEAGTRELERN